MNKNSQITTPPISSTVPDWSREKINNIWDPGRQLLRSIRTYQKLQDGNHIFSNLRSKICIIQHRFWSTVSGADIPLTCSLGGGLLLTHPNGVVIHPNSIIGPNCLLLQQVTIVEGVEVGGHVDIGAGAKIVRGITIGNNAKIGANAVVLQDIPEGAIAVGIPAKVV